MFSSDTYFKAILAARCFELELPIQFVDLKRVYGSKIHMVPAEGVETFDDAYKFLSSLHGWSRVFVREIPGDKPLPKTTREGDLLSGLGLGLGLGPDAIVEDCSRCKHHGYTTHFTENEKRCCTNCDDNGQVPQEFPCRSCAGSGKFKQRRFKTRMVNCRTCKGSGKLKHPRLKVPCKLCKGTRNILVPIPESIFYSTCVSCVGSGEFEAKVLNPVLSKKIAMAMTAE